ncbi:hypothetical protein GYMLUDRAFT_559020, partial [Collybiopsis luxurians FD-317 M1]
LYRPRGRPRNSLCSGGSYSKGFYALLFFISAIVVFNGLALVWRMCYFSSNSTDWWVSNRQPSHPQELPRTSKLSLLVISTNLRVSPSTPF